MSEKLSSIAAPQVQATLVDELIAPTRPPTETHAAPTAIVGECVDIHHPSLTGRVRVEWRDSENAPHVQWLPCLQGLTVRVQDRVLVQYAENWPEPVIIGVVDGFAMRPEAQYLTGPSLTLEKDEVLRVATREGQPLLEICQEESGPVVRLLNDNVDLDIAGRFRINASSIVLEANRGSVSIKAEDDIIVEGEIIRLN